ncbi:hypothetical protein N9N71_01085 [Synechococcus sp. AH-229-G18]|nr:hypothetical protein [Synechococcus sp. AH-229-G18]
MNKDEGGLIVPLVVIFGMIIGAVLLTTSTRSWLGLSGAIRQGEARSARGVAEAGMSKLIESLNSSYAHLLVVDDDNWSNPPLTQGICPNSITTGTPATVGLIGTNGRYELEKYDYRGTFFYGGEADIRMRGELLKDPNKPKSAVAIVEQTVQIKPKSCETPPDEPAPTSGFPGLLAQDVTMCGNDLKGRLSGNLFCTSCIDNIPNNCSVDSSTPLDTYSTNDQICVVGGNQNQTDIDGNIYLNILAFPPVPVPPSEMNDLYDNPPDIDTTTTIVGGSVDSSELLNGACRVADGITHCVVNNINLSGSKILTINTTGDNPVRMYVNGDSVDFKGKSGMVHISDPNSDSSLSTNFGFFGRPIDPTDQYTDQSVILRGRGSALNMWAYFPDGDLGIKGGAGDDVSCDTNGTCTGGDIYGSVWAKKWGQSCGTGAAIVVPPDIGKEIKEEYGSEYSIGMRDYSAIGVSKWKSFIVDSQ